MKWVRRILRSSVILLGALHLPLQADGQVATYRTIGDRDLSAYVFEPEHPRSAETVILLFHGGGYFTGTPKSTFEAARTFSRAGAIAVAIEYRLSDGEHTPLDALSDACAAIEWVRNLPIAPEREPEIALYGVSAGAHLAANTVTHGCGKRREPAAALLLSSPGIDVLKHASRFARLLKGQGLVEDHAPLEMMTAALPPLAIVHGEEDRIDPISTSRRLCGKQRGFGGVCKLLPVPGRGHLLSRNLDRQIPGPGFDPDPEAHARALAFFTDFLRSNGLLPPGNQAKAE